MAFCPNDLIEVFSHLPAKAICKFRCTSKSLSKITEETLFTKKQIHNSLNMDDTCFFLQEETSQMDNEELQLYPLPGNQSSSGVPEDVMRFLSNSTKILASTKGLILCCRRRKIPVELFICNPATKSWLPIPLPKQLQERPCHDITMLFIQCFDAADDYMLFHVEWPKDFRNLRNYGCNVYKPKEGEWKAMEKSFHAGGRLMQFNMPVYCNGCIHFISDCAPYQKSSVFFAPYIMSYNLENGSSKMLTLPKDARRGLYNLESDMGIFSWGKSSICLVRLGKSIFTIWILVDYESNRWQRILKIRIKELGLKDKDPKITGFTIMNNNLLVFATETRIYSYDLSDRNVEERCQHRCKSNVSFTSYLDSLRECGPRATSMPC